MEQRHLEQRVVNISINDLKPHPRNLEFFDDLSGEEYEHLRDSISDVGIQAPVIAAEDMTIISGHQRFRAAKELGLQVIPVIIREDIKTDEEILQQLIAGNFGRTKNNEAKRRKALAEYVRLRGYKNGEAGLNRMNSPEGLGDRLDNKLTLAQIADELGISEKNLRRSLSIERNLTESMKELLDAGVIGKNLAADCIATMTPEEQEELISQLDATKKYARSQIQPYIDKIKSLESARDDAVSRLSDSRRDNDDLKARISGMMQEIETLKAPQYESPSNYATITSNSRELATLMYKIQDMLDKDLSPLRFSKLLDNLSPGDVDMKNLKALVSKVTTWCEDMYRYINSESVEIYDDQGTGKNLQIFDPNMEEIVYGN